MPPSPRSTSGPKQNNKRPVSRGACAGAGKFGEEGAAREGCSPLPGCREGVRRAELPAGPRGLLLLLLRASRDRPRLSLAAALPRRPAPAPARPVAHRHLQRPIAGYDRHVGIRVGKLPLFHVASFQRHLPAARRGRRALPAGGGRKAVGRRSGAPVRAGPRRLGRPGRAAPAQKLTAGRRVGRHRSGFRPDLPPLTRMLWTGLPAALLLLLLFPASTSAHRQAPLSPGASLAVHAGHWPACGPGEPLLQPLFLSHPQAKVTKPLFQRC